MRFGSSAGMRDVPFDEFPRLGLPEPVPGLVARHIASPASKVSEIQSVPEDTTSGLSAVFEANRHALRRFLMARRALAEEADDILQELFVRIGNSRAGPIADPLAYLYRAADNLLLDLRRRRAAGTCVKRHGWRLATGPAKSMTSPPPRNG